MSEAEKMGRDLNEKSDDNKELLKRIIEIQDLPEEVVIRFLKSAGSLSSTEFGKRSLDEPG